MDWIAKRAERFPERLAVVDAETRLTFAELDAAGAARAQELAAEGVAPGETVPIELPAGAAFVIEMNALAKLGAVAFPLDPRLSAPERRAALDAARAAPQDDVVLRMLTGGSTGSPKAVGLTAANLQWSAAGVAQNIGVDPTDRWLCCLPLFHMGGLAMVLRSAILGITVEIHEAFDAERVARALTEGEITIVSMVATQLARVLDVGGDVARPRVIMVGAGPLPPSLLERAADAGATIVQTYGMTETATGVTALAPADARRKLGSAGRPLLTSKVELSPEGEILVSGPTVAPGALGPDGRLHTGDLGRIDDEGFLWVTGRVSEKIITGGENVMPAEVEAVLVAHPAVADVAVVGRPDPEWQEAVTAIVVVSGDDPGDEALRAHCAESLAPYKVPKAFERRDSLPRTDAGKLRRAEL